MAKLPLFELAFRPFFLLAALFSVLAMGVWIGFLNGWLGLTFGTDIGNGPRLSPVVWHLHEMIFGFAVTVAVGFLLTAVQTWTSRPSVTGWPLLALVALWLVIRFGLYVPGSLGLLPIIVLQAVWWLGVIVIFSRLVFGAQNRLNYLFVPLLVGLMSLNLGILIAEYNDNTPLAMHLARTAILMFSLLMTILGGRVIPFFTSNGAKLAKIIPSKPLEMLLLGLTLMSITVFFIGYFVALPFSPGLLLIAAGCLHIARISRWKSLATRSITLLWSLHLSYFSLGVGIILLGASYFNAAISFSSALHFITIGAIGLMIFSMMSRVSLGHTGRMLTPHIVVKFVFILVAAAALSRVLLPLISQPLMAWNSSALLWIVAALLFLIVYTPILIKPRAT